MYSADFQTFTTSSFTGENKFILLGLLTELNSRRLRFALSHALQSAGFDDWIGRICQYIQTFFFLITSFFFKRPQKDCISINIVYIIISSG